MTTIQLTNPLTHGAIEIHELTLRTPKARDLRDFSFSDLDKFNKIQLLVAKLCGLPPSVLDNLECADLLKCSEVVLNFLQHSPKIQE